MEKALVNNDYLLQKYPGKGGWTYAAIHEILQDKHSHFGWVKVKGNIDDYHFKNYRLMPMGNGQLFLPVNAAVRKLIGKKAGDWVKVVLYADHDPVEIPTTFLECLQDEPKAHQQFLNYTDGEKKAMIDWIEAAKKTSTQTERIVQTITALLKGQTKIT